MPKLPPVDRFRITCETQDVELGPLIAQLTRMGFTNIHFELITDIRTYGQKQTHDVPAEAYLRTWLVDHPTFAAKDAIKFFREGERTDGAGYTALRTLVEKGELKKLGPGNYQRSDVKALAPPKKGKTAQPVTRKHHDVDHREFILGYARMRHGRFSRKPLMAYFEQHKRNPASVGGALNVLMNDKKIKALGEGEYLLLAKGGAKPTTKPKTTGNGVDKTPAAQMTEIATHG